MLSWPARHPPAWRSALAAPRPNPRACRNSVRLALCRMTRSPTPRLRACRSKTRPRSSTRVLPLALATIRKPSATKPPKTSPICSRPAMDGLRKFALELLEREGLEVVELLENIGHGSARYTDLCRVLPARDRSAPDFPPARSASGAAPRSGQRNTSIIVRGSAAAAEGSLHSLLNRAVMGSRLHLRAAMTLSAIRIGFSFPVKMRPVSRRKPADF